VPLTLKSFSFSEYEQLVGKSVVLEQDRRGVKVLETPEGLIVKIFRQKRVLSSALLKPYAIRFVENARSLKMLGIRAVEIQDLYYCKPNKRALVFYQPIPGQTLRTMLQSQANLDDMMKRFIVLLANLHDKGVLFRSIHFNNIIVSDGSGVLGLIDFADMKIGKKSLSRDQRMRNFRHLTRYEVDQESIKAFGVERFMTLYFAACHLPESDKQLLLARMQDAVSAGGRI
jgi:tRNA A-37 threonylcarbamoyl transferase component Bud32